jgi:hypothetical protein
MALKIPAYISTRYQDVIDGVTRLALQDIAQKLEKLARDADQGLIFAGAILITLGACPEGWEVVVELDGRVPLGTLPAHKNVHTLGGSMALAHTHAITADPGHVHPVSGGTTTFLAGSGASITAVAPPVNTTTAGAHSHGGATGGASLTDITPAHVKVLFCRRKAVRS